jgi:hypothetical protein
VQSHIAGEAELGVSDEFSREWGDIRDVDQELLVGIAGESWLVVEALIPWFLDDGFSGTRDFFVEGSDLVKFDVAVER